MCRASATSASSTTFGQQTPLTPEQVQKRQKQLQDLVQESVKIGLETGGCVGGCSSWWWLQLEEQGLDAFQW